MGGRRGGGGGGGGGGAAGAGQVPAPLVIFVARAAVEYPEMYPNNQSEPHMELGEEGGQKGEQQKFGRGGGWRRERQAWPRGEVSLPRRAFGVEE